MLRWLLWAGACLACLPALASADSDGVRWSVTPYMWASETRFDLKSDGAPIGSGKVTFDDLMDVTDASFQIASEAAFGDGTWSALVDVTYIETSDRVNGRIFRLKTQSEQWFVDAAAVWRPWGEQGGFSVLAGARYTDLDDRYKLSIPQSGRPVGTLDTSRDFLDALVGVRQIFSLADRWSLAARADYSDGDSKGIFQLQAIVRYGLGMERQCGLMFGYRYKQAKFEHDGLEEKFKYQGPLIGFNFLL